MLTLLDVPLSRELDGAVPEDVFAANFSGSPSWTDAYTMKPVSLPPGQDSTAPEHKLMLERLRGLGYIE